VDITQAPARLEFVSRVAAALAESDPFGDRMSGNTKRVPTFLKQLVGKMSTDDYGRSAPYNDCCMVLLYSSCVFGNLCRLVVVA